MRWNHYNGSLTNKIKLVVDVINIDYSLLVTYMEIIRVSYVELTHE